MALIKDGSLVDDPFTDVSGLDGIPATGAIIVSLDQWQANRETLQTREEALGIRLRSDQSPEHIGEYADSFSVIALEFPAFRDGRAYSYARLLRERYGYEKELRAIGDVLLEQLHFMLRTGFDAFEIVGDDPITAYRTALQEFSVWYQPTGDGRRTATDLRHRSRS